MLELWNVRVKFFVCSSVFQLKNKGRLLLPSLFLLIHHRKEVIQPQVLLRLPCYDFTPITSNTVGVCLPASGIGSTTSSIADFRGVTGGVYKARERIHRDMLIRDY